MNDRTMTISQCLLQHGRFASHQTVTGNYYYLVTSAGKAGNIGRKDQREDTHVCEDFFAQVVGELVVGLKQKT